MAIIIASNIVSLKLSRALSESTQSLQTTFERLSSGQRINRASDDPGGLAISEALLVDARVARVALRNASDGLSLININDAAISEIINTLSRMAELAEQSANGVFTNIQRSAMAREFEALGSEIQRISVATKFNNINLLSSGGQVTLQVGFNSFSTSVLQIGDFRATLSTLSLSGAGSDALSYSIIANSEENAQAAAVTALAAVKAAIDAATQKRGLLGAYESRLSFAIENLQVARENFIAAGASIRDVDVAREVANMMRNQVLQQANVALLAQANVQPQVALQLLGVGK